NDAKITNISTTSPSSNKVIGSWNGGTNVTASGVDYSIDFENGLSEVTYKASSQTRFNSITITYTADLNEKCTSFTDAQINDNGVISWTADISNVASYNIYNGNSVLAEGISVENTSYIITDPLVAGTYSFSIEAIPTDLETYSISKSEPISYTIGTVGNITGFKYTQSTGISWTAVAGATGYKVTKGTDVPVIVTSPSFTCTLHKSVTQTESIAITVQALGNRTTTYPCANLIDGAVYNYTYENRKLAAVESDSIQFSDSGNSITWNAASNVTDLTLGTNYGYHVVLEDENGAQIFAEDILNSTTCDLTDKTIPDGLYTFSVTTISKTAYGTTTKGIYCTDSEVSEQLIEFDRLNTPVVSVSPEGLISWDEIENASKYSITVEGFDTISITDPTETSINVSEFGSIIGGNYDISVVAVGKVSDNGDTLYRDSAAATTTYDAPALKLASFTNVSCTAGETAGTVKVNFIGDANAESYTVTIDGVDYEDYTSGTEIALPGTSKYTNYSVSIKAIGDGTQYADSDVSTLNYYIDRTMTEDSAVGESQQKTSSIEMDGSYIPTSYKTDSTSNDDILEFLNLAKYGTYPYLQIKKTTGLIRNNSPISGSYTVSITYYYSASNNTIYIDQDAQKFSDTISTSDSEIANPTTDGNTYTYTLNQPYFEICANGAVYFTDFTVSYLEEGRTDNVQLFAQQSNYADAESTGNIRIISPIIPIDYTKVGFVIEKLNCVNNTYSVALSRDFECQYHYTTINSQTVYGDNSSYHEASEYNANRFFVLTVMNVPVAFSIRVAAYYEDDNNQRYFTESKIYQTQVGNAISELTNITIK
ncbi:MAG: hypothetical protein WCR67_01685, partial [Bacilli bacterium]